MFTSAGCCPTVAPRLQEVQKIRASFYTVSVSEDVPSYDTGSKLKVCVIVSMCDAYETYFLALRLIAAANRLRKLETSRPLVHKAVFLHMSVTGSLHANQRERSHATSRYLTTKNASCYIPSATERRSAALHVLGSACRGNTINKLTNESNASNEVCLR